MKNSNIWRQPDKKLKYHAYITTRIINNLTQIHLDDMSLCGKKSDYHYEGEISIADLKKELHKSEKYCTHCNQILTNLINELTSLKSIKNSGNQIISPSSSDIDYDYLEIELYQIKKTGGLRIESFLDTNHLIKVKKFPSNLKIATFIAKRIGVFITLKNKFNASHLNLTKPIGFKIKFGELLIDVTPECSNLKPTINKKAQSNEELSRKIETILNGKIKRTVKF